MNYENQLTEFCEQIGPSTTWEELLDGLRKLKRCGFTRERVLAALGERRSRATNEVDEDRVLEVMDIVAGHCRAEARIWANGDTMQAG